MSQVDSQDMVKYWRDQAIATFFFLLRRWYLLLLALLAGGALVYYRVSKVKPQYTATISFVLSTDQKDRNAFSGLASQLGFDGITASPDNIFSGENIIELFKSRKLISNALLTEIDKKSHLTLVNYIAQREYAAFYKRLGPFGKDPLVYNAAQLRLFRMIISKVSTSVTVFKKDKKLIFYLISAKSADPGVAYNLSKYMLDQTSKYFIDTKTKVASTSVNLLRHEADSLARVLMNTYSSTAAMNDRTYNLNPSISIQRSGLMFSQAKASALSSAYIEVMRNLEIAKINLQKETPLYRIIDEPELPLFAIKPNVKRKVFIGAFIGLCLMAAVLAGWRFYKTNYIKK
jgi:uncharacterized protein involved in exopolysaccharide biosynthesis